MNIDEIKASVRLVWKGLLVTQPKLSDDAIIEEDVVEEMTMLFDLTIRRLLEEQAKYIVEELTSINSGDRMDTYEYKDRINALIKELQVIG